MAALKKRKGKNNWEICYPLPVKLREILRTPALNRSLGTPDKAEAKRRFPMRLVEVETEVASLMAQHFPDDDTALLELRELINAFKQADDTSEGPNDFSEKDILLDAMRDWGERQRSKRLKAYRGTSHFEHQKALAGALQSKADEMIGEATNPRPKIADLVDHWRNDVKPRLSDSTKEEYERAVKRFMGWCRGKRYIYFTEIDRPQVREFVADCYHGKLGKTVKLAIGGLGGVWDHAFTIGWINEKTRVWRDHDYADRVRVGTGERKTEDEEEMAFSFDDIRTVLRGIKPSGFCDVFRLGLITGARSAELSALRPKHLTKESDGYWLELPGTKSDSARRRRVPVAKMFEPLAERLAGQDGNQYLVPLYPGKEWPTERDRSRYINKELNRKRRDLDMPDKERQGVHSTRRTFTELLEGAEVLDGTIKLLIGHKRTDITKGRYSKGVYVDLRAAVEKLAYPEDIVGLINKTTPPDS